MQSIQVKNPILQDFLQRIDPVRQDITRIVLFGSCARGDFTSDSDYDLLLVVLAKHDRLIDVLYEAVMDVLLACGRLVSLKVFEAQEFMRLQALCIPIHSTGGAGGDRAWIERNRS